jgi:hypothetical protein
MGVIKSFPIVDKNLPTDRESIALIFSNNHIKGKLNPS